MSIRITKKWTRNFLNFHYTCIWKKSQALFLKLEVIATYYPLYFEVHDLTNDRTEENTIRLTIRWRTLLHECKCQRLMISPLSTPCLDLKGIVLHALNCTPPSRPFQTRPIWRWEAHSPWGRGSGQWESRADGSNSGGFGGYAWQNTWFKVGISKKKAIESWNWRAGLLHV